FRNIPGLLRLARREWRLGQDFERDRTQQFDPLLQKIQYTPTASLPPEAILSRIEEILAALQRATYYSILAPLSLAIRQAIFKVPDAVLDASQNPEVASLNELNQLATGARTLLSEAKLERITNAASLFAELAENKDGSTVIDQFNQFLERYGYLSEVGTDIAVPTWQEAPYPVRELFAQFVLSSSPPKASAQSAPASTRKQAMIQRRLHLKGQVTEVYSRLLAELRGCFVALEARGIEAGWLRAEKDIFFLNYVEVRSQLTQSDEHLPGDLTAVVAARRYRYEQDEMLDPIPYLVYGNEPPNLARYTPTPQSGSQSFQGIAASPGQIEGTVRVLKNLQAVEDINRSTILVVPYTDAGWAPLLARAGGLIAEVGGRLSHGAIVAREYGIPAVMDVTEATQRFQDGQRVRLDGAAGTVEIL
ncbi:MAG: PEP-utilizing enzyme, partial [Cyanobacteria bacterium J06626_18]